MRDTIDIAREAGAKEYTAEEHSCFFVLNKNELELFEALVRADERSVEPVAFVDRTDLQKVSEHFEPTISKHPVSEYDVGLYTTPTAAAPYVAPQLVQEPVATLIDHYGFTDGVVRFDGVENMEQLPIGTKFYIAPLAAPVQEKNT